MSELDIRHISIIDALPVYGETKTVLEVGAGRCKIAAHLADLGYDVTALDIEARDNWESLKEKENLTLVVGDIFEHTVDSLPHEKYDVVICSEVLEHLPEYRKAFETLKNTATQRIIITVPHGSSFLELGPPPIGHCNFWYNSWNDGPLRDLDPANPDNRVEIWYNQGAPDAELLVKTTPKFISEFVTASKPYSIGISTIRTKVEDVKSNESCYLIVIDKRQKYAQAT